MLPKKKRLTRKEFDSLFSKGVRRHDNMLQVISAKTSIFHGSVVVGKKIYQKAVQRNRLRRQLYGHLRSFAKRSGSTYSYIVLVKSGIVHVSQRDIKEALMKLLETTPKDR